MSDSAYALRLAMALGTGQKKLANTLRGLMYSDNEADLLAACARAEALLEMKADAYLTERRDRDGKWTGGAGGVRSAIEPDYSWVNPDFQSRPDRRSAGYSSIISTLAAGDAPGPEDFLFTATGGGEGDCYAIAADIAKNLSGHGATMDEGHFDGAGAENGHAWARLADGTIIDATASQFLGPERPVVVARPGSDLYSRYIPYAFETADEADSRFLDPPSPSDASSFKFPPPAGRR